jgi:poly(3-hydroxybutyrate) depolymerase
MLTGFAVLLATLNGAGSLPPDSAILLRYDLRPGDHLIYRETYRREVDGRGAPPMGPGSPPDLLVMESRATGTDHLLVTGLHDQDVVVGLQHDRSGMTLTRYELGGKDLLKENRSDFEAQRPPASLAEANVLSIGGIARLPPIVSREWPSPMLWVAVELALLPPTPVKPGNTWSSSEREGPSLRYRAVGWEKQGAQDCLHLEGTGPGLMPTPGQERPGDLLLLRFWYCPQSGLLQRIELEGSSVRHEKMTERVTLELVERRRGEQVEDWLGDPETRLGALAALNLDQSPAPEWSRLEPLLASGDTTATRLALAVAYRRGVVPPSLDPVAPLLQSPDPRVRSLAAEVIASTGEKGQALLELARRDGDYFVRSAARGWARPAADSGASAASCRADTAQLARRQEGRYPAQPPGIRLRTLTAADYQGWPFVLQVPDDYRSDTPTPLLIYLSGGAGSAMDAMLLVRWAMTRTGYLAVYPHASGWWWWRDQTGMVDALLDQLERDFNVDPQRIYVSGMSNGGTGVFYFANLWPQRFSAAVSAMGAGLLYPGVAGDGPPEPRNTANLPLLFLHGRRDSTIAPLATELTVKQLGKRAAPAETHYFKELGHEVILGRTDEGRTLAFMQRFEQRALPRSIAFTLRGVRYTRHYWVEIVERGDGLIGASSAAGTLTLESATKLAAQEPATVEGRIEGDNTIRLTTKNVKRLRLLLREDLLPKEGPIRVVVNQKQLFEGPVPFDCATYRQSLERSPDPILAYSAAIDLSP